MANFKDSWNQFGEGMWRQTPPLFTALGLCPSLAVTTAAINGLVMGLSTTAVLLGTALVTLAIRNIVPREVRIPVYTVVIATLVTVVDLLLSGLVPDVHAVLGLFIPLIVVNCIILGRVEVAFTRLNVSSSIADALGYGLGFTWALTVIGAIREIFAGGTVFGFRVLAEGATAWQIFRTPPGAFFTMGLIVAFIQMLRMRAAKGRSRETARKETVQAA